VVKISTHKQCDQKKIAKSLLKLPKNDFTRKSTAFDTFTKMSKNVGDLGKLIVAFGFKKVAQSPINCPIWSHWCHSTADLGANFIRCEWRKVKLVQKVK